MALLRFRAIQYLDSRTVPASAIFFAMAREMLLEAEIDPVAVDGIDQQLPSADVLTMLEEAGEIVAEWERDARGD